MGTTVLMALWMSAASLGVSIPQADVQEQNRLFQRFWGSDFVWKFDDLPVKGGIEEERIPYSGSIYLDKYGGTVSAMRKYDRAFHGGRMLATAHEQWDTSAFQEPVTQRGGLFGRRQVTRMSTPNWHGHCNGWAAAAIRHAEPQRSVSHNGVVFSPADIKGLLADLYIYNDVADLSGSAANIQAALFHAVVANWIGRGAHPLGLEADPGREKWNYPAYAYDCTASKISAQQVDVRLNLTYARESQGEYQQSPRIARKKFFHYRLDLNPAGEIVGGAYYGDSSRIDMLWVPLRPKASGQPGHERGNPHIKVETILSLWRASVPEETRKKWLIVDPAPEDRVMDVASATSLVPLQDPDAVHAAARPATAATAAADVPAAAPEAD
ncbi:MAG: hypothetical protein GX575_14000 [Candidatus Anammoximicrobium sp.]|nr:hypothetical protein [Candidatus Anammoximicrobium sp.]